MSVPVANSLPAIPAAAHAALNARELDYLARLALNEPRKAIAMHEHIDRTAVDQVIRRALGKLGTDNLLDAFRVLGWLRTDEGVVPHG